MACQRLLGALQRQGRLARGPLFPRFMGRQLKYRGLAIVWPLAAMLGLSGCGITPQAGPSSVAIPLSSDSLPYAFVKLTSDVAAKLAQNSTSIANVFSDRRPPVGFRYGIGDVVGVTIFESAAGGLFIPAEAAVASRQLHYACQTKPSTITAIFTCHMLATSAQSAELKTRCKKR